VRRLRAGAGKREGSSVNTTREGDVDVDTKAAASMEIIELGARTCAHWWAGFLREGALLDNGDKSPNAPIIQTMAHRLQEMERKGLTPEAIDRFETVLAELITKKAKATIARGWLSPVCTYVDYDPDMPLRDALEVVGIKGTKCLLPWKTGAWLFLDDGHVEAKLGYGGDTIRLGPLSA